jgi:hypothetical protein
LAVGLDAEESTADWEVYVSGGLGISGSIVDTDGTVPGTPRLTLSRVSIVARAFVATS